MCLSPTRSGKKRAATVEVFVWYVASRREAAAAGFVHQ
jgi:hypothetical protein